MSIGVVLSNKDRNEASPVFPLRFPFCSRIPLSFYHDFSGSSSYDHDFWRVQYSYYIDSPSVWVCLKFSHFWQEQHKVTHALLWGSCQAAHEVALSLVVMLIWIIWLMASPRFCHWKFTRREEPWHCADILFLIILPPWISAHLDGFCKRPCSHLA